MKNSSERDYKEVYVKLRILINECKKKSQEFSDVKSPTSSHFYASILFTKITVTSMTLLSIAPDYEKIGKNEHWDSSSFATLLRGLLETYLVFFYLCIERCDEDEWNTRWRLMNYHDHMSRIKLFKSIDDYEEVDKFKTLSAEVKNELEKTNSFQKLSDGQKKLLLKGTKAFTKSQDEIIESSNNSISDFRFKYIFLSNQAHSFPMSFYRMVDNNFGCGVETPTEIERKSLFISWANECLESAVKDFVHLWDK